MRQKKEQNVNFITYELCRIRIRDVFRELDTNLVFTVRSDPIFSRWSDLDPGNNPSGSATKVLGLLQVGFVAIRY